jgi:hypothetical protein
MRHAFAAAVVLALALAGCGGTNWSSGAPAPTTGTHGGATRTPTKAARTTVPVSAKGHTPGKKPPASTPATAPATTPTTPLTAAQSTPTPTTAPGDGSVSISGIDPAITSVGVANLEWVEYNDPSGVALSHPRSWTIHSASVGPVVISIDGDAPDSGGFRRTVNLLEQPLADGLTAADYLTYTLAQIAASGGVVESSAPIKLDGVAGHATTWHTSGGVAHRFLSVWAVRGQLAFLVTYSSDTRNFATPLVDVKRLIASIRLPPRR